MIKIDITSSEPNKAPSQPAEGQEPAQQNPPQNDQSDKDKPAQQK